MIRNSLTFLVAFLLLCSPAWAQAGVGAAKVAEVSGDVRVLRGGDESKTETASAGLALNAGDVVKTGADGQARIEMGPDNTTLLQADSTLKIDSKPNAPNLNLLGGKLLSKLKNIPKGEKVAIGTPTSIAGIEGTTFAVSVSGKGATEVDVLSGSVRVQSAGEPNKFTSVTELRRVRVSAWEDTLFVATGSGVASEKYKRPRILEGGKEVLVVRAQGIGSPAADAAGAEAQRASAEKAAMDAALRELGERVLRAQITPEENVGDLAGKDKEIYKKISDLVAKAQVIKRQPLGEGGVEVEVELTASNLNAALGLKTPVFTAAMVQVSPEKYTQLFTPRARLTTEQAAKTVADRDLLEQIRGVMINAQTTVQDFALQDDRVTAKVDGVIRGAETVGMRYFSDGTVEVTRRVKGTDVRISINALTKKETLGIHYLGKPSEMDPLWYETLRRFEEGARR